MRRQANPADVPPFLRRSRHSSRRLAALPVMEPAAFLTWLCPTGEYRNDWACVLE